MNLTLHPEFWWYATRATGITAWVAALGSGLAGLALATRTLGNRPRGPWLLDLHRGLSGVTLAFTAFHLTSLVADSYVHFGAADLLVPLASDWKPLAVAGGIVAMWLYVAVEATSLAMKRLPKRLWHAIHLSSYLAFAAATAHMFTAGTDATNPAILGIAGAAVLGAVFMLTYRVAAPAKPARRIPSRPVATKTPAGSPAQS